jgi:hypothetical protein
MNTFPQDIAPLLAQFAGPSGIKKLGSTNKRNYATEKTLQLSKKKILDAILFQTCFILHGKTMSDCRWIFPSSN